MAEMIASIVDSKFKPTTFNQKSTQATSTPGSTVSAPPPVLATKIASPSAPSIWARRNNNHKDDQYEFCVNFFFNLMKKKYIEYNVDCIITINVSNFIFELKFIKCVHEQEKRACRCR